MTVTFLNKDKKSFTVSNQENNWRRMFTFKYNLYVVGFEENQTVMIIEVLI